MTEIDLSNKTALITGASRGIGAEIAKTYARAGAHVILLARTVGGLEDVDDTIRREGGNATLMPLDLLKFDDLEKLGPTLYERFGGLDIFVANAGMLGTLGPLAHGDPKEWDRVYDLNVGVNFRLIRTLDPLLKNSEAGRVIIVGSGAAHNPKAYWGAYRSSKAAVEVLGLTYADECRKTNIRVNVVHPGPIETAMLDSAYPGGYEGADKRVPEDIMPTFLDLASPSCMAHGDVIKA